MGVAEKTAYLKGLADGLKLDASQDEGKLIYAVIGALESAAEELEALREEQTELSETLEAVSDDLADVEAFLSASGEDEEARYSAACPACGETVRFDESVLESGEIVCPNCGRTLEFDLESPEDAPEDGETSEE